MTDAAFKIALLLLLTIISGFFIVRLSTGISYPWRTGRLGVHQKGKSTGRVVRSSSHPVEFWFTMAFWHGMLIASLVLFFLGFYGIWRVVFAR